MGVFKRMGVIVAAVALCFTTAVEAQQSVSWVNDWNQAAQMAKAQHRLVLLHFWDDNCPPCRKLEQGVFSKPEFLRAVQTNYVPAKINVSQNRKLADRLGIHQWPTDVIVTADGQELFRGVSPQDLNRYTAVLDQVAAHARLNLPAGPTSQLGQGIAQNSAPGAYPRQGALTANPYTRGDFATRDSALNQGGAFRTDTAIRQPAAQPANNRFVNQPPQYSSQGPSNQGLSNQPVNRGPSSPGQFAASQPLAASQPYGASQYRTNQSGTNQYGAGQYGARAANDSRVAQQSAYGPRAGENGSVSPTSYQAGSGGSFPIQAGAPTNRAAPSAQNQPQPMDNQFVVPSSANRPLDPTAAAGRQVQAGPTNGQAITRQPTESSVDSSRLGLEGYCPVTLAEQERWVKGDRQWGAVHRGRTFLFASAEAQHKFLSNFDRYAPALSGFDPVRYADLGQLVDGKRAHGVFYRDQVYLFSSEASLQQFWNAPERYVPVVEAERQRQATLDRTRR